MKTLFSILVLLAPIANATPMWRGTIPGFAQDPNRWALLLQKLEEKQMPHGALAAASRMLTLFTDLPTKELAYQTVIKLIDLGYPFPIRSVFAAGDIEPQSDKEFADSYYFYKATLAKEKGMERWAEHYFSFVDKENFPKYLFYSALDAYSKKDFSASEKLLKKILSLQLERSQLGLIKKVARTLARIYYELEQHEKSLDIYESFLLKLNPVTPSDWLETAWNRYHLRRFDRALGALYNLESVVPSDSVSLEKYLVRALIHQELCATNDMEALLGTFEKDFGKTLSAIKSGESLSHLESLTTLAHPANVDFHHIRTSVLALQEEQRGGFEFSPELRNLAEYLYRTELAALNNRIGFYRETALARAADQLIHFSESLRFLKFDVAREKYNPEVVFQRKDRVLSSLVRELPDERFQIRWLQQGDFWRDERPDYIGVVNNKCSG